MEAERQLYSQLVSDDKIALCPVAVCLGFHYSQLHLRFLHPAALHADRILGR